MFPLSMTFSMTLMALNCKQLKHFNLTMQGVVEGLIFLVFGSSKIGSQDDVYLKTPKGTRSPELERCHGPLRYVSEMQDVCFYKNFENRLDRIASHWHHARQ